MSEDTDPDRFYQEAETYLHALATLRGLGLAQGRWTHPRYGSLKIIAVNGRVGALHVTLVVCETDARWELGMARLWWYMNDWAEPFQFKHVVRPPMAEIIINRERPIGEEIGERLRWLEGLDSIEEAVGALYGKALSVLSKADEAAADPDNELSDDDSQEVT